VNLVECYEAGDFQQAGLIAHRIRGGAANAGLREIELACATLEENLTSMESNACSISIKELSETIEAWTHSTPSALRTT